jgi:hypothetical protein
MPTSSTLTEQLEGGCSTGDWIQQAQAYAEGVVDLLLQHHERCDQLTP